MEFEKRKVTSVTSLRLIIFSALLVVGNFASAQSWTPTSAPSDQWRCVTCSADGGKLAACMTVSGFTNGGAIYLSTNSGNTWNKSSAPTNYPWFCIASSADGTKLLAAGLNGPMFTSADSGLTWISNKVTTTWWESVSSSSDGTKLAAAVNGGGIFISTNSGNVWTQTTAPIRFWESIVSSASGDKLFAAAIDVGASPLICLSTNFGTTWVTNNPPAGVSLSSTACTGCSADGSFLVIAGGTSSYIDTSTNFGTTWMSNSVPNQVWYSLASSADGRKLLAVGNNGIYTSTNFGHIWIQSSTLNEYWPSIVCSADGNKLAAAVDSGFIYNSFSTPSPQLTLSSSNSTLNFSWLVPSTNFALQQSLDLSANNWSTLTNLPMLNFTNLQNQITLMPTNGCVFFRLVSQ
jgi:photosystem II stability/assembly factor-like uncharacterized protein